MSSEHDNTVGDIASSLKTAGTLVAKQAERTQVMKVTLQSAYAAYGKAVFKDAALHDGLGDFVKKVRTLVDERQRLKQASESQPAATSLTQKAQQMATDAAGLAQTKALDLRLRVELARLGRAAYELNARPSGLENLTAPIAKSLDQVGRLNKEIDDLTVATKKAWISPQRAVLAGAVLFAVLALAGFRPGSWGNAAVRMVRNGHLEACSDATVGDMVSGFMGSPSWTSGVTEDGDTFVNVSGDISVHEKKVRAILQFFVDQKKGTFKFNALEFNGVPQPLIATAALLHQMCESTKK
jgi:hypothetical protein